MVSLPRLYAGLHYVSDLVAGASIGVAAVIGVAKLRPYQYLKAPFDVVERDYPGVLEVMYFLCAFQFATVFGDLRELMSVTSRALGMLL